MFCFGSIEVDAHAVNNRAKHNKLLDFFMVVFLMLDEENVTEF
jgi:hypothetical protein